MQTLYSTAQTSEVTGIPASTIRSWLSRYPEIFQLGVHVIKDGNGRNMWTSLGIDLLRQRQAGNATESATESATGNDAFFDPTTDAIANQFLDLAADVRARHILQQLPARTLQRLREMIKSSPEVQQTLQSTIYTLAQYQLPGTSNATAEE